jgi:hypothetical protein
MGDTSAGLSATYDAFSEYVRSTLTLREALLKRYFLTMVAKQPRIAKLYWSSMGLSNFITPMLRLLGVSTNTGRLAPADSAGLLAVASETERAKPELAHAISTYWIDDLAAECCSRFSLNTSKVTALEKIDAIRTAPTPWERLTSLQRFVVGAGVVLGLFAAVVTKDAFEAVGWDVKAYGYLTFGVGCAVIAIALLLAFLAKPGEGKRAAAFVPTVIAYCAIQCELSRSGSVTAGTA